MSARPIIERAFEMARSGQYARVADLEKALFGEGYPRSSGQLMAPTLRKQLRAECLKARMNEAS